MGPGHTGKNNHHCKGKKMSTNMRICWATVLAVVAITLSVPVQSEPRTKEVCKDVVDKKGNAVKNKDGTTKQSCKKIKVHKKLEGTPVPTKK
jgi:hypothetical protein